jgi:hypothetical protein
MAVSLFHFSEFCDLGPQCLPAVDWWSDRKQTHFGGVEKMQWEDGVLQIAILTLELLGNKIQGQKAPQQGQQGALLLFECVHTSSSNGCSWGLCGMKTGTCLRVKF